MQILSNNWLQLIFKALTKDNLSKQKIKRCPQLSTRSKVKVSKRIICCQRKWHRRLAAIQERYSIKNNTCLVTIRWSMAWRFKLIVKRPAFPIELAHSWINKSVKSPTMKIPVAGCTSLNFSGKAITNQKTRLRPSGRRVWIGFRRVSPRRRFFIRIAYHVCPTCRRLFIGLIGPYGVSCRTGEIVPGCCWLRICKSWSTINLAKYSGSRT